MHTTIFAAGRFGSLLLGAVPGLTFPLLAGLTMAIRTGPADSPAWVMTLAFLAIGVVGAGGGIIVSRTYRWVAARWKSEGYI